MKPLRWILHGKIHQATVTDANLAYEGSITIDEALMELVHFWPGEKVLVVDNTNGARLETYVIRGQRDSGVITINGTAAHLVRPGDEIIIMGFELSHKPLTDPTIILVDQHNRYVRHL